MLSKCLEHYACCYSDHANVCRWLSRHQKNVNVKSYLFCFTIAVSDHYKRNIPQYYVKVADVMISLG